ncbi:MAG: SDR family oxidoreductase [Candidatus Moranbacteria bacterium]|nr:SDR family oxidoreductase [Candidatus Moranbacteria bacterium]
MNNQKNIVITGVTKGIGLELAKTFLEKGDRVFGIARSTEMPEEFKSDENFTYWSLHIDSPQAVEQLFADSKIKFDLIINCAGILKLKNLDSTSVEDWKETMEVNTSGSFHIAKYGTSHFLKNNKKGMIIFIGSRWGRSGSAKAPAYAASKSALRALVKSFQQEGIISGIRYILLSPGSVLTEMSLSVDKDLTDNILQTHDIAELIAYLSNTPDRMIFDEISVKAFPYDFKND